MFKKLSILLAMLSAFAFFAVSCSSDSETDLTPILDRLDQLEQQLSASSNTASIQQLEQMIAALQEQFAAAILNGDNGDDLLELQKMIADLELQLADLNRFYPEMLGLVPGATITELGITWWSLKSNQTAGSQALVRVYSEDSALVGTFEGRAVDAPPSNSKRSHQVTLTGLTANTKYKYSVSNNGTNWSDLYDYQTPPAAAAFKFAAVADVQIADNDGQDPSNRVSSATKLFPYTTSNGWARTIDRIAAKGASFIVSAGDQVDPVAYTQHTYEKFFSPSLSRSIPLAPSLGNHDTHCEFFMHYNMPNLDQKNPPRIACPAGNSGTGFGSASITANTPGLGNYFYLYNNVLFVVLNTASYPNSKAAATPYVDAFDANIKAAKAAHPAHDWLIVQHHKSTQSLADHPSDTDIDYYIQAGFEKIMNDNGVDLVIAGHDHVYVRSKPLKWVAEQTYACGTDGEEEVKDEEGEVIGTNPIWINPTNPDLTECTGVSVPSADGSGTVYLTLNTGSGLKYYDVFTPAAAPTVRSEAIPVLFDLTSGRTQLRENSPTIADNVNAAPNTSLISALTAEQQAKSPIGTAFYSQEYKLSYTIFEVNGASMTVTTRTSADDAVVETFTITPKGRF